MAPAPTGAVQSDSNGKSELAGPRWAASKHQHITIICDLREQIIYIEQYAIALLPKRSKTVRKNKICGTYRRMIWQLIERTLQHIYHLLQ